MAMLKDGFKWAALAVLGVVVGLAVVNRVKAQVPALKKVLGE